MCCCLPGLYNINQDWLFVSPSKFYLPHKSVCPCVQCLLYLAAGLSVLRWEFTKENKKVRKKEKKELDQESDQDKKEKENTLFFHVF